jgi:membrane-bound ClpP family serine protease
MIPSLGLAYALIAVGVVLLIAEVLLGSGGILFGLSLAAIVIGVAMTFFVTNDPTIGLATLLGVFLGAPILGSVLIRIYPRTPWGRRMVLQAPQDDATVARMPVNLELEHYRGQFGRALSSLRPSGTVEFDGKRIDVLTEGGSVEAGELVRCIEVRAGRVIVRRVDPVDLKTLEDEPIE